ncbi:MULTISPECIES: hypothetical protein [Xanthomonas]|uniref:GIY-YIG nuclease family protein n=2 Tax=Xanthomonas perforans TaxID=442694 RepID=A0ABR5EV20_XANPE|nr:MULTISPECIES: hypothetical protein [Xanthomonas]KLC04474.1 hypothetical protein XP420_15340 [Xanthomonas perforans]KLC07843.1 hypothetical protein XP315_08520 [Xanthomonas perforans]KLC17362.1 hypothetical protein XP712_17455 [Xanthomonas perforans]KLC46651.1 hypothetical protein XP1511_06110 [Xanthomonas perforans]KLC64108.1 hypothetical protein GEV872_04375 [Xanthomonas perforans]
MKRALKRWWVYLAAVPLADGRSAFRLGRSVDLAATLKQVQDASPVRIAKVWTMPTCSERAACAAVAGMASDLGKYWQHGPWLHMHTDQQVDKAAMKQAMDAAGVHADWPDGASGKAWREAPM